MLIRHTDPAARPAASPRTRRRRRRVIILVLDGMRPSSINAKFTPTLAALAARGVTYTQSRTGFPSETLVGAGELFSGSYPEHSGITSNNMIVPGGPSLGTALKSPSGIATMRRAYGGRAIRFTSLFEALGRAGMTSAVIGKEGPAELAWYAGATWTASTGSVRSSRRGREIEAAKGIEPLEELVRHAVGAAPEKGKADDRKRSQWFAAAAAAIDAAHAPDLLTLWLTDPDHSQHGHGVGTVNQRHALREADLAVKSLLDSMRRRGQLDNTDIIITSDHGFSEHLTDKNIDMERVLKAGGIDATHVVGVGNQHFIRFRKAPTRADFRKLHDVIAASPLASVVSTIIDNPRAVDRSDRRGDSRLTGRDLRVGMVRAADAYVIYRRDEGIPGPRSKGGRGPAHVPATPGTSVAGHGSLGWSDLNNTLVLSGPDFERPQGSSAPLRTANPAGIVDIAPTILHLLGAPRPRAMQGRVLRESLAASAGGNGNGIVEDVAWRTSTAWQDVRLGARTVRTGLVTQWVGLSSYFVGLLTEEK